MEMTKHQKRLYEIGCEMRKDYPEYGFRIAFGEALMSWKSYAEYIDYNLEDDLDAPFLNAGFYGDVPEWVKAKRYGEIPENGRSKNFATGELEKGVSCVQIVGRIGATNGRVYDTIYSAQGIKCITVAGWFLGRSGSDGEPLLHRAIKMEG